MATWTETALDRAKTVWQSSEDRDRRSLAARRLRYMSGDQANEIPGMPDETPLHKARKPTFAPGILQLAARVMSYLYSVPAVRTTGDPSLDETWDRVLWSYSDEVDGVLRDIDPQVRILGQVQLLLQYSPSMSMARDYAALLAGAGRPASGSDGMEAIPITPDRCAVVASSTDPRVADAMVLDVGPSKTKPGRILHYWDPACFAVIDTGQAGGWKLLPTLVNGKEELVLEHKYGRVPVVEARNCRVYDRYWAPGIGGPDLLVNVDTINRMLTEYLWTALLQRGQPWARGLRESIGLAPDSVWKLDDGPSSACGIMTGGANLPGMREAVATALHSFAKCLGLPPRAFQLEQIDSQSGVAIWLDRQELHDDRLDRAAIARQWERGIHETAKAVWSAHTGESLPLPVDVTYPDPIPRPSHDQARELARLELDYSLSNRVEAVLMLHPDLSVEEAEARVAAADADTVGLALAEPPSMDEPPQEPDVDDEDATGDE